jgi:regulator of RNase E activity RraA
VVGELFATEAKRRGLAGIVVDGLCRDVAGLRRLGLPFFARGTVPASGSTVSRAALRQRVRCGGVDVGPGDIVFGDDDGLVIAPPDRLAAALEGGEAIARAERAMLAAMAEGRPLHDLTSYAEHVAVLDDGRESALEFRVD